MRSIAPFDTGSGARGARGRKTTFFGSWQQNLLTIFGNLAEARKIIENWRIDYKTQRRHTSLGGLAPAVYANLNRAARPASPELRKGSAQQALTATISTERNRNGFYT
ncbi:integrase core domain-containing protein [Ruegeria sp. SCP10]|uniref:integrase core domain-containing protein n=1 Tax=Ruegeria sp. SCP10 TaxID=3141377 RepID=UPI003336212C